MENLEKYVASIVDTLVMAGKAICLAKFVKEDKSLELVNKTIEAEKQKILELAKAFEGE